MVGIVLVSHSRPLAEAVLGMVRSMTGPDLPVAIAAGAGDGHQELGTDAVEVAEAIVSLKGTDGVVVLMDIGSAILSSETALDLLDERVRAKVRFCAAPFVEGAVAAGVTANLGSSIDDVCNEALRALKQKQYALDPVEQSVPEIPTPPKPPLVAKGLVPAANGNVNGKTTRIQVTVRNPHGLHARPAAKLITESRQFHSDITVRNMTNQRGPVSIRSLSNLAALEILEGNEIEVAARGDDSNAALDKIKKLVESGLGDPLAVVRPRPPVLSPPTDAPRLSPNPIGVSPGIVIGLATYFPPDHVEIPEERAEVPAAEVGRLQNAIGRAQQNIEERLRRVGSVIGSENAGIYEAQILALQDPELSDTACRIIREEKLNAAMAWDRANRQVVRRYESLKDPYLRERAADLKDVGRQVIDLLVGRKTVAPSPSEPGIVIADNLAPYQVTALDPKMVQGVVLLDGGPTAHATILLKALSIPAIINARSVFADIDLKWPQALAFDGGIGKIWVDPDDDFLAELKARQVEERRREAEELKTAEQPAQTLDGHRIGIMSNVGDAASAEEALHFGAEGVGLLRTEFLYLNRETPPSEDEQVRALVDIADRLNGKQIVVRTLDVGGDKELPYLPRAAEENPFLGVRAIRLSLSHEKLFATQLRAILRAADGRDFHVMFPMIANTTDMERAMGHLASAHEELERKKIRHLWPVKTGVMIEIPSAALQAEAMAAQVDFFSIGTNDLTQYTLAADRGNPDLASYQDALHPAVLRLISMVVNGAHRHDRPVAICGEAASDERAAAIFVGLGVQELSLASSRIPRLKAFLRRHSFAGLQRQAHTALHCRTAAEVRAIIPS